MTTTDLFKGASRTRLAILLSIAIAGPVGCGDASAPPTDEAAHDPGPPVGPHDEAGGMLMDDRFMMIAEKVPEFGGMFVDAEANILFVHVTDQRPGIKAALWRAIHDVFPRHALPARIRLLDARFSFEQLMRWHKSAAAVYEIAGVTQTDIDDRANRLSIGVTTEGLEGVLEQGLTAVGVPPEGWQTKVAQAVEPLTSVNDSHRPLRGGLEIGRLSAGFCLSSCTLGFNAVRSGAAGFVTASHCTNTQGGVESTQFVQPCFLGGNIGTETVDPPYFTNASDGNCPVQCGFGVSMGTCQCRFSDTAFVLRTSGVSAHRSIVRNSNVFGTLAWDGTSRYPVFSETDPVVGQNVRKVGRTTGNTIGTVTETCINVGQDKSRTLILCQGIAPALASAGGDSGSPVFTTADCSVDGSNRCARLRGIVWGGGGVFSPIANVQRTGELGPLATCFGGAC